MAIKRTIQFKRNSSISENAVAARTTLLAQNENLVNGEIILNSYVDENARNGIATIIGIKTFGKMFIIDNQVILNKLGINDDGTVNDSSTDSIEKLIATIINGAGLASGGTYSQDSLDVILSGATSLANADSILSSEIQSIEDFIGMGESATGHSIVERISIISGNVATLSGKSITDVSDTSTIDFTKVLAGDGTQTIKADVKVSNSIISGNSNSILVKDDGIFVGVDYDKDTNSLVINGEKKPLEKYSFGEKDDTHNVEFVVNSVSGTPTVQAEVSVFDCGEY